MKNADEALIEALEEMKLAKEECQAYLAKQPKQERLNEIVNWVMLGVAALGFVIAIMLSVW